MKCIEADMTQAKRGEEVGTTGQYANWLIRKGNSIVHKTVAQMTEVFGCDIQLTNVKREEER